VIQAEHDLPVERGMEKKGQQLYFRRAAAQGGFKSQGRREPLLPLRGTKGLLAVHTDAQCGEFLLEEWLINPVRSILRQRNWGCISEVGNAETRPGQWVAVRPARHGRDCGAHGAGP
jgi:chromosome condensin MukBEF MukE localization factor